MKKFRFLPYFLILLSVAAFVSCEDAPGLDPEGSANGTANFKASYDNGIYTADDAYVESANGNITITGINSDSGQSVVMSFAGTGGGIFDDISATYMMGGTQYENTNPDNGTNYGTVVINSVDNVSHTVSGYFSFRVWSLEDPSAEPLVFFDGSFQNIPYTGELTATVPDTGGDEYFKAKIDGGDLTTFENVMVNPNSGMLQIVGTHVANVSAIQLVVAQDIQPDSYSIGDNFDDIPAGYVTSTGGYAATEGTLTIISNTNNVIKGTFNFTAADGDGNTVVITEGSFRVSY